MSASEDAAELAYASFWDARYENGLSDAKPTHEWFRGFDSLKTWFANHLFDHWGPELRPKILHLGCGDSTVPHDLHKLGYNSQLCVDFSAVVVRQMSARYADDKGITWQCADVRCLPLEPSSVDVAFDKGTLDAMIFGSPWDPPDIVKENTSRYMEEVHRVLKADGVFLYVTFRQPHFVRPLLEGGQGGWSIQMEPLSDGEGSFDYFGYVLRKK